MKQLFTLLLIAGFLGSVYAQRQESPADMAKNWPRGPVNIGTVVFPTGGNQTTVPPARTEASYETLIAEADAFYGNKQYDAAATRYKEALQKKDDAYPKDQLMRIEAERAKAQKEQAIADAGKAEQARLDALHKVHFTGLVMSDSFSMSGISHMYVDDKYSNFLKPGKYDDLNEVLKNAGQTTLDGIAIPAGTRLVVYKNTGCSGEILLDITGPAVVNNMKWQNDNRYKDANTKNYTPDLQPTYPQTVRFWSDTDMHGWISGSLEIIAL